MTVINKVQTNVLFTDGKGYIDISFENLGIVRVASSELSSNFPVKSKKWIKDIEEIIEKNYDFFQKIRSKGVEDVLKESTNSINWGNGWEWKETRHPGLDREYTITHAVTWYTTPFNSQAKEKPSKNIYNQYPNTVNNKGIEVSQSYRNRQPVRFFFFFPFLT